MKNEKDLGCEANDSVNPVGGENFVSTETPNANSGSTHCSPFSIERWDEDYHPEFREALYTIKRMYYDEPDRVERYRMFAAASWFIHSSWMRDADWITRDDMKIRYPRLWEDLEKLPCPWQRRDDL